MGFGILPSFSQSIKQFKNRDFFPWFYILSDCEDFLSGRIYVLGRGASSHYVTILWQLKCWKHCLQAKMKVNIANFPKGSTAATTSNPQLFFGTNYTCSLTLRFAQSLPNPWSHFFYFKNRPWLSLHIWN